MSDSAWVVVLPRLPTEIMHIIAKFADYPRLSEVSRAWRAVCPFDRRLARAIISGVYTLVSYKGRMLYDDGKNIWTCRTIDKMSGVFKNGVLVEKFLDVIYTTAGYPNVWMHMHPEPQWAFAIDNVESSDTCLAKLKIGTFIGDRPDAVFSRNRLVCRVGSQFLVGEYMDVRVIGFYKGKYIKYVDEHRVAYGNMEYSVDVSILDFVRQGWNENKYLSEVVSIDDVDHHFLINLDNPRKKHEISQLRKKEYLEIVCFKNPLFDFCFAVKCFSDMEMGAANYSVRMVWPVVTDTFHFESFIVYRGVLIGTDGKSLTFISRTGTVIKHPMKIHVHSGAFDTTDPFFTKIEDKKYYILMH